MQFGVFDHVDRAGPDLAAFYRDRLRLTELYDRIGISRYHVAEHHATPLGMAPSPSVFLSAVAQRTTRLRFGPMVFAMPLYHPLRLAEEICMLDQMSDGRLELGFGRGASPIEASFFGHERTAMAEVYEEGMKIVLDALANGKLDHAGKYFEFADVPLCLEPVQHPHPPLWYGVHAAESATRAAQRRLNMISLDSAQMTRAYVEAYHDAYHHSTDKDAPEPLIGISYFMVISEDGEEAREIARRAYPVWWASFNYLFKRMGSSPRHVRPAHFDTLVEQGCAFAGTPKETRDFLRDACDVAGINYLLGQFAFGDQTYAETERTMRLFADHVMPAFK